MVSSASVRFVTQEPPWLRSTPLHAVPRFSPVPSAVLTRRSSGTSGPAGAGPSAAQLGVGVHRRAMSNFSRILVAVVLGAGLVAAYAADAEHLTLMLGDVEYQHRWSQRGQHEFTPKAQEDLARWQDMVTVNVHEAIKSDDQLKGLAASVLSNYKKAGKVLRAASGARSDKDPTEYFVAALLGNSEFIEAAFARIVLIDGTGFVLVQSRRGYGSDAAQRIGEWIQKNGSSVEEALLAWKGVPSLPSLKQLPESK